MIRVYCRKCRSNLGHYIARGKASPEMCQQVSVVPTSTPGIFQCACERCGHSWKSKAPSVRLRHEELLSAEVKKGKCGNCGASSRERKMCICCRHSVCETCFVATERLCRRCIELVADKLIPLRKRTAAPTGYTRCLNCMSLLWVAEGERNCTACGVSYVGQRLKCWKCRFDGYVPDAQRSCDQCNAFLGRFIDAT